MLEVNNIAQDITNPQVDVIHMSIYATDFLSNHNSGLLGISHMYKQKNSQRSNSAPKKLM